MSNTRFATVALLASLPFALALACGGSGAPEGDGGVTPPPITSGELKTSVVVTGLDTPWDMAWGPDGMMWVSERGGRISRVDAATGQRTTAGQLTVTENSESGLLGIAFHPDFAAQPYVYAMHSYSAGGGIRNRLVRMRWQASSLGAPETLVDDIPGGGIHDGSRLAIGPDRLLYVTTGDAGNGANAQNKASLAGKILRLTLDGKPAPGNAFGTAVYSFGHRNPQGMVFSPTGALYITEHGPSDNDEVNLVAAGRNHGWPDVHGFCDNDGGGGGGEKAFCTANSVVEPLVTWTPTIAPSGADYYDAALIPGWRRSLLFTSLGGNSLWRLALSADGRTVTGQERLFQGRFGRLRDVLVGPRGEVYIATSNRDGRGSPAADDDRIIRIEP
jgi:aldose sugar dehydrogenase